MKVKHSIILVLGFCSCLAACKTGKSEYSADAVNAKQQLQKQLQTDLIVGYWKAEKAGQYDVEFFQSVTDGPLANTVKTGRLLKDGNITHLFDWSASADGVVQLNLVNSGCPQRPISSCETIARVRLSAAGKSSDQSDWLLEFDNNLDGITDNSVESRYFRQRLDTTVFTPGEHYFAHAQTFDLPVQLVVAGNQMQIQMNDLEKPITLKAVLSASNVDQILFPDDNTNFITHEQEFLIPDVGYQTLSIKQWYKNVTIKASVNGRYSVSYEIVNELIVPENLDPSAISSGAINKVDRFTRLAELISKFIPAEPVMAPVTYYSFFYGLIDDSISIAGGANQIEFTSDDSGHISRTDLYQDRHSSQTNFTWTQDSEGQVELTLANGDHLAIRFIEPVNGGYRVLMAHDNEVWGKQFYIHDLIRDDDVVDLDTLLPGRFSFTSNDGFSTHFVEFKENGEVEFSDLQGLSGYWFINDGGEVVSYECTDLYGLVVQTYQDCYAAFESLESNPSMQFAHIRKLRFMHKNGNELQAKYDANVWGGIFQIVDQEYLGVAWTYRWRYLGEPSKE